MPDIVQEGTLFFCSSHVSVFSPSLEMQSIVEALAVPRGPRLPAKACPHALPRALPARAHEQAVQERESLDFLGLYIFVPAFLQMIFCPAVSFNHLSGT